MAQATQAGEAAIIKVESKKLKRELTLLPLFGLIYFTVCGGTFGIEGLIGYSGPGLAMLLIFLTPIVYSIPNMLMVREMNSMMPREGGYYHWIKQAFGPFTGFIAGWMNWVVSWVDVSIYPVLAAYYLSYFIPALRDGATIFGIDFSASTLSWFVALILIWAISYLGIHGARLSGLFTNWLGAVMLIPLVLMSAVGIYSWLISDTTPVLSFIPPNETMTGALSVGLFIIMWNYMGWELPTAAGDEIVNPKRTYPLAMLLVLIAAIATYAIPVYAGLYGGAGDDGRYMMWGIEESEEGAGIGADLEAYGVTPEQMDSWGVDPSAAVGWELPDIAHTVAAKVFGEESSIPRALGTSVLVAAVLSMIGLFIGNSLGGTRIPFALAEDGMMPKWMVKVHPRYGTPWVSIVFCGILFSIFSLNAFAFLVVVDVFLNILTLLLCFMALWKLRFTKPDLPRQKIPGGYIGLILATAGPTLVFLIAVYSQIVEEGMNSLWLALAAIGLGILVYFPMRRIVKPGVPDVDPYEEGPEAE
jgi:amino acid transporter